MPVGAIAAALGHGLANGLGGTDSISTWSNYATQARQIQANQAFQRRFNRIDYTLKHQQLHREDIRDLCELTVGRMDVYLIVGTLVLTFCIGWYTNNSILESGLPSWFITLFLLSNFTASAYMVFAVWLAMHASVAAHSISVRLLTSAARLSIPSAQDIEDIQTSVMPSLAEFMSVGQSLIQAAQNAFSEKGPGEAKSLGEKAVGKGGEKAAAKAGSSASTDKPETDDEEDDTEDMPIKGMVRDDHFKRFLHEQRRWLGYDAYARICMCFGMNQMLQSLSYYILGMVWKVSPVSAIVSYLAVKMLGCLLLQLDVTGFDGSGGRKDTLVLLFLYLLPPIIASFILRVSNWSWSYSNPNLLTLLVSPVFILHAGWLVYLACELYRGGRQEGAEAHALPTRLKTVAYLNVLQPEQKHLVVERNLEELQSHIVRMRMAQEQLGKLMEESMLDEAQNKKLGKRSRGRRSLAQAQKDLVESIAEARKVTELAGQTDEAVEREFRRAKRMVDRFAVWDQAPEICAVLKAFKDREVQGWLSDEEKRVVETATQDFLTKCQDLGLGVEAVAQKDTTLPQCEREKRTVRIESYNDLFSTPCSVWISMKSGEVHEAPPPERSSFLRSSYARLSESRSSMSRLSHPRLSQFRMSQSGPRPSQVPHFESSVVDFHSAFQVALPHWSRSAANASRPSIPGIEMASMGHIAEETESEDASYVATKSFIPGSAAPDDRLPGMLVQKLTLGTAAIWLLCAFFYPLKGWLMSTGAIAIESATLPSRLSFFKQNALRPLATTWPIPASFLEVGALQCHRYGSEQDAHQVFVGGEFSTYVAQRFSGGNLGTFTEIAELAGGASAIFCDASRCNALVRKSRGRPWVLQPIGNLPKHSKFSSRALVHMPSDWLGPVAAAWYSPNGDQNVQVRSQRSRAAVVRIAAWDGSGIVIADMIQKDSLEAAWTVKPRFRLFPEEAPHPQRNETESALWNVTKYDDVRALQLSEDARTLIVLQGNDILDAWDVGRGDLVARWYIDGGEGGSYTAMCYDGQDLLLARQLNDGLELQAIEAPVHLQSIFLKVVTHRATQVAVSEVEIKMQAWSRNVEAMVQLSLSDSEVISV